MARRVVVYNDFTGGEFGDRGPWNSPKNTFTGRNMLVYETGELGVRPGLQDVTPNAGDASVAGEVFMLAPEVGAGTYLFGQGQNLKAVQYHGGSATRTLSTFAGTFNAGTPAAASASWCREGDQLYMANTRGIYQTTGGSTLTTLNNALPSRAIALYGDRLIVASDAAPGFVRYSDASVFTSWPTAQTFGVGSSTTSITGMIAQRQHLTIVKQYEGIYTVTGTLNVNETLRRTLPLLGLRQFSNMARTTDGFVWMKGTTFPRVWDGATLREYDYLHLDTVEATVAAMSQLDRTGVCYNNTLGADTAQYFNTPTTYLYMNGVWTAHDFTAINRSASEGVQHIISTPPMIYAENPIPGAPIDLRQTDSFVIGQTRTGAVPNFYAWSPGLNRPGSEYTATFGTLGISTQWAPERSGDLDNHAVEGNFSLTEWWSDEGSEIHVLGVIVDFRKWDTGSVDSNHFEVRVDTLRRYAGGGFSSPVEAWDEPNALGSTDGTLDRVHMSFGAQGEGNGFQVHFSRCRGIAIRRIQVIIESSPVRM